MRAIVLLGGEGTRLRPLTYSVPKPMLPIAGKPMVAHTIEWLGRNGIDQVIFALGYRPDAFREAFPGSEWAGVELVYAVESDPLDTAGAIRFAAESVGATDERLVVCNGDVLTEMDLKALIGFHERAGAEGTIHLTPVADPSAFGVVPTDPDGRVLAFIEKPPPGTAPTNLINAGTYILESAAMARIDGGRRVSIEREVFPAMVADGALYAHADGAYWIDIGTATTFLRAHLDVLAGMRPDVVLPPCPDERERIYAGEGVEIHGEVIAPVLLGNRVHIELGAVVSGSVLGDDVLVGPGAYVLDSVILDNAIIQEGARIESSIVGGGAVIGAGASLRAASIVGFDQEITAGESLDGARVPA
jgi:mannose-1-phosphate guanylyltransferase